MRIAAILLISILTISCQNEKPTEEKEEVKRKVEQVLEYYEDGKKKVEGKLINGERHGMWTYYYENGFIWSEGKFWHGKRKGYSYVYYENGRKQLEGAYDEGLKIGIWKLWGKDGDLHKTINMDELLSAEDSLKLQLK